MGFTLEQPLPHVIIKASLDVNESRLVEAFGLLILFDPHAGRLRVNGDVAGHHLVRHTLDVVTQLGELVRA